MQVKYLLHNTCVRTHIVDIHQKFGLFSHFLHKSFGGMAKSSYLCIVNKTKGYQVFRLRLLVVQVLVSKFKVDLKRLFIQGQQVLESQVNKRLFIQGRRTKWETCESRTLQSYEKFGNIVFRVRNFDKVRSCVFFLSFYFVLPTKSIIFAHNNKIRYVLWLNIPFGMKNIGSCCYSCIRRSLWV